jgi:hypothetical protein
LSFLKVGLFLACTPLFAKIFVNSARHNHLFGAIENCSVAKEAIRMQGLTLGGARVLYLTGTCVRPVVEDSRVGFQSVLKPGCLSFFGGTKKKIAVWDCDLAVVVVGRVF